MVRGLALVVVAGCGRVGFEALDLPDPDAVACAAPVGHDEDRDGVDDACDLCPHLPAASLDRDGDGVGDSCDPHPDEPRDRIALFDPFTQLHERWIFFGAVPAYTGDAIEFDARESNFTANLDQPPGESTYQLGGFIRAPGSGQRQITILALSEGTNPYYFCELNQTAADPVPRVQYTYTYDDDVFTAVGTVAISGELEQRAFDLTFGQTDAELVCGSTLAPNSVGGPLRGDIAPVVVTIGGLGIQARYDYFIQIASD